MTQADSANDKASRRAALFRESTGQRLQRAVFGSLRAIQPKRAGSVALTARFMLRDLLGGAGLPDPLSAPKSHDGLCGTARDLSVSTLLEAHSHGLHPASHAGPVKWWSPPERCVLFFDEFHMSKRLRSRLRQARHTVTFDRDFEAVITACAEPRPGKWPVTWITPKLMHAYAALHDGGFAHSFEVWNRDSELVGGGYGVAIGGIFIVESQFAREDNASKIGFSVLNWHLAHWGFALNDNKGPARHVLEMGFRVIPRGDYLARLPGIVSQPGRTGPWRVEADLPTVAAWQPGSAGHMQAAE
ncbi:MAG: leucyl/phenylalanyl-tRNA--protein transferase [Pseudorhodoplanes sp.]|jgi:leucyl/phenylalanyl-tRNA--protein transferase|nr:leucyl/phenylalanyl-tRNA--protein transferase [Pseudorhodoplanes sp.]